LEKKKQINRRNKMQLTEKQMIKIFRDKSWGSLSEDEMKQFNIFMFGEEFMESDNKGSKVIYNQRKKS
tara:strand:- start:1240 stop:1443 length:204 start_codon:yes stop_codon:yes gene_type:complete